MTPPLQVWLCSLQLAVRNTPQNIFIGAVCPKLECHFTVFPLVFFVRHPFHYLDFFFFWHVEVKGKLFVVNQESDHHFILVIFGETETSKAKLQSEISVWSLCCYYTIIILRLFPAWEVGLLRRSFHHGKKCTPTCLPAECSPPWCQRGRPRQGGGPAANWKQAQGKWCMAASGCGLKKLNKIRNSLKCLWRLYLIRLPEAGDDVAFFFCFVLFFFFARQQ